MGSVHIQFVRLDYSIKKPGYVLIFPGAQQMTLMLMILPSGMIYRFMMRRSHAKTAHYRCHGMRVSFKGT